MVGSERGARFPHGRPLRQDKRGAGARAAASGTAAAAAAAAAESLAMAAAEARMTAAAEGPRGAAKLVRGTRNMAARERD